MRSDIVLNDSTIIDLFGNEAAESESIERLREYFYKNRAYERFDEKLPLRILVGPKGTGKSAIFRYTIDEAKAKTLPYFNLTEDFWPELENSDELQST